MKKILPRQVFFFTLLNSPAMAFAVDSPVMLTPKLPLEYNCLPDDVPVNTVVSRESTTGNDGKTGIINVGQKLKELKGSCENGRLIDGNGKEIYFYRLIGCWGNPPRNYKAMLDKQSEEIKELGRRYTVIELTCNPTGAQIQ